MPLKILLIEDNPDHLEITKRILQKSGYDYEVDCAMDSHEGLKKIFQGSYDVVLCDYRLPEVTALDILREMNNKGNDTPFIVVTALGSEKVAVDMMKEGAYDYIVKDILYRDTLDIVIKKAIDRYRVKKEKERLENEIREAYEKLKETQDQLIQAEKLNAVGQLASGVAHEVRNPLAIIMQSVDYLVSKVSSEHKEVFKIMTDNIKRANDIICTLLDFSKAGALNITPQDINSILESSLLLVEHGTKLENIKVVKELAKDLPKVLVDDNKIQQVFVNIFLNAIQAMTNGGNLSIRTYVAEFNEPKNGVGRRKGDYFKLKEKAVAVEIKDTGTGITEENMKKIFDPFFTTKGPRGGIGLGLSVSKNIITMHKDLIEIKSESGKGTTVTITLKVSMDA